LHDLVGLCPNFRPKFAKSYISEILEEFANRLPTKSDLITFGKSARKDRFHEMTRIAVEKFIDEVRSNVFSDETYSYKD